MFDAGMSGSLLALLGTPGQMKDTPWELNLIRKKKNELGVKLGENSAALGTQARHRAQF